MFRSCGPPTGAEFVVVSMIPVALGSSTIGNVRAGSRTQEAGTAIARGTIEPATCPRYRPATRASGFRDSYAKGDSNRTVLPSYEIMIGLAVSNDPVAGCPSTEIVALAGRVRSPRTSTKALDVGGADASQTLCLTLIAPTSYCSHAAGNPPSARWRDRKSVV